MLALKAMFSIITLSMKRTIMITVIMEGLSKQAKIKENYNFKFLKKNGLFSLKMTCFSTQHMWKNVHFEEHTKLFLVNPFVLQLLNSKFVWLTGYIPPVFHFHINYQNFADLSLVVIRAYLDHIKLKWHNV